MMKTHFSLIFLALSTVILNPMITKAQSSSETSTTTCVGELPNYLAPENLAMMAYQGYLEKQGIPGYEVFEEEYNLGKITASQIIQAAVKGCLLSDQYGVASDSNYVEDVDMQVRNLVQENR